MRKAQIAVFVSGGGTNLQALIDQAGKTLTSGELALVVADRPCYAKERAEKAGINWNMVELPVFNVPAAALFTGAIYMVAKDPQRQAATWDFIRFFFRQHCIFYALFEINLELIYSILFSNNNVFNQLIRNIQISFLSFQLV